MVRFSARPRVKMVTFSCSTLGQWSVVRETEKVTGVPRATLLHLVGGLQSELYWRSISAGLLSVICMEVVISSYLSSTMLMMLAPSAERMST